MRVARKGSIEFQNFGDCQFRRKTAKYGECQRSPNNSARRIVIDLGSEGADGDGQKTF
jgi:hypothetical protein